MKKTKKTVQWLLVIAVIIFALTSCGSGKDDCSQKLETEHQECTLRNHTHVTGMVYPFFIGIDMPVKGPQTLMDSLTSFLNESLYRYFDDDGEYRRLPYESVYSRDLEHLLEHYQEAYRPFFMADSSEEHEFNSDCLTIQLVAQTDKYVTYELDWIYFLEGDVIASEWVTFDKCDGHRLGEIISDEKMQRFFEEHPECWDKGVWEYTQWKFSDGNDMLAGNPVGLVGDTIAYQFMFAPGILEDLRFPLEAIKPYLSEEAQKLVK